MTAQALIFDLDDTLMDTYGQLVPEAHRQACLAMQQAGLDVPLETLYATRQRLLQEQPRESVDHLLATHYGYPDPEIIAAGHHTYFNPTIQTLEPFPGVPEMLQRLNQSYPLFLVTSGYEQTQARKVQALGIGPCFAEILYVPVNERQGKEQRFRYLQQKYAYAAAQMVVIGDRVSNEIAAGNRLGCPTIWIRHGECAHILPEHPEETPTLVAQHILQVPDLLQQIYPQQDRYS